jgi:hypothetical protein
MRDEVLIPKQQRNETNSTNYDRGLGYAPMKKNKVRYYAHSVYKNKFLMGLGKWAKFDMQKIFLHEE